MKVESGKEVHIEYTGTLDDGTVFDTNVGKDALVFVSGQGRVIKGFEEGVLGLKVGDTKKFKITAKDAYGEHNSMLVQNIPKEMVPANLKVQKGMMLMLQSPTGQKIPAKITDVKEDVVILDMNHPLAGKDLTFTIKILDVKDVVKKDIKESQKAKPTKSSEVPAKKAEPVAKKSEAPAKKVEPAQKTKDAPAKKKAPSAKKQ